MNHILDDDLPMYLVFLILGHVKELEKVAPDHILVQAVRQALENEPRQYGLDLSHTAATDNARPQSGDTPPAARR